MKRHLFAALLAAAVCAGTLHAQQDLSQDQVAAYVAVVKADLARDAGSVAEARRYYQEAADLYTAIAKIDPAWHPDIVEFRLSYCQSQLEALRGRSEGERPAADAGLEPGAPDPATAEALQRLAFLETENKELTGQALALEAEMASLSNRVDQLLKELQAAEAAPPEKGKSRGRDADKLQKELKACQEAREAVEKERAALQAEVARRETADEQGAEDVKAELARMRERMEESTRQLEATREAALKLLQPAAPPAQQP